MALQTTDLSSPWQKSPLHSTGVASRLTALFVGRIWPDMFPPHALSAGRATRLGATRGFSPRAVRYPIGRFSPADPVTRAQVDAWIGDVAALPADLRRTVAALTDAQLDTPYRPDGWTVRQVVHHLADSHMNSLVRFNTARGRL